MWHSILIECVTDTKIYFLLQDFIVSDLLFSFWSPAGEENKSSEDKRNLDRGLRMDEVRLLGDWKSITRDRTSSSILKPLNIDFFFLPCARNNRILS